MDDEQPPLGLVPTEGRGSAPYTLVHGESFVAAASWALGAAGVELLDYAVGLDGVRSSGRVLVIHDPLCPLTPAGFIELAVAESVRTRAVVVGVRPVTDTVKQRSGDAGRLGATVDRMDLVCVTSPVVLPATVGGALEALDTRDLATLVADLSGRFPVHLLEAPPLGRRVSGPGDLDLLSALSSVRS